MSCSFCRDPNHTINHCNNQNILRLWFDIYNIFLNFKNEPIYSNDINRLYHRMRIILGRNYTVSELKVICYRKILNFSSTRRSKTYLIDRIIEECSMEYNLPNRIEWGIDRTPENSPILNNVENQRYNIPVHIAIPVRLAQHYDMSSTSIGFNITFEIKPETEIKKLENETIFECGICYENQPNIECIEYRCNHQMCSSCVKQILAITSLNNGPTCPFCREPVKEIRVKNQEVLDDICGKTYFV